SSPLRAPAASAYSCAIYFLWFPRPPRSTLVPTRRSSDLSHADPGADRRGDHRRRRDGLVPGASPRRALEARDRGDRARLSRQRRSEEHTSELQSREKLVCRLLLEKKKDHWTRLVRNRSEQ